EALPRLRLFLVAGRLRPRPLDGPRPRDPCGHAERLTAMRAASTRQGRRGQSRSRMADVARLAGVSTATVSRALRQPEVVSEELRSRIGAAIERLAYRPNLMAGGLATARSRTVGVIVPSIINSFFA